MPARLLRFVCSVFLVLGTAGCGIAFVYPGECRNEAPTPDARNYFGVADDGSAQPPWPTKSVFLKAWGQPDRIERVSDGCETWVYEKNLWCGVVPIFILPVPLVLPVCDGFDRIEFRGDTARLLHTRRILMAGGIFPGGGGVDPACRNPIPIPLRERIQSGRSVSLSVSIDTPEHREGKDYRELSGLVRDRLMPELAQSGIFTEILPAPESADYRLDVVVTTAQIRRRVFSFVPDNRVVLQVQLTFRETGQRIGEFEIHQRSEYVTTGLSYVVRRSVEEIIRVLKDD
jgi:hypothetical protein